MGVGREGERDKDGWRQRGVEGGGEEDTESHGDSDALRRRRRVWRRRVREMVTERN